MRDNDNFKKELAEKFAAIDKQWTPAINHPFYNHGEYYEHKVVWNDSVMKKEMFIWLAENCTNKFSVDLMEHKKEFCDWNDKIHISFINKEDAIHFRMVWI